MNTKILRKVGYILIGTGITLFLGGVGCCTFANVIDLDKHTLQVSKEKEDIELETKRIESQMSKDLQEKIHNMDPDTFAKYKAEKEAKLSKEAELKVIQTKNECADKINEIRLECERKVSDAKETADKYIEKYNNLEKLFVNKDEILAAKESIKKATMQSEKAKEATDKARTLVIKLDD